MKKLVKWASALVLSSTAAAFADVAVSSPADGSTVGSPVHFVASADATEGIAAMRVYVDNNSVLLTYSNSVDTYISMGGGAHYVVVIAWDNAGNAYTRALNLAVSGGTSVVSVSSPTAGQNIGSPAHFVASSNSPGQYPISAMQIYVDDQLDYSNSGSQLDTYVNLGSGSHRAVVKAWDTSGQDYSQEVDFSVGSSASTSSGAGGATTGGASVTVTSPADGSSSASSIHVVGSAQAPAGIAGMHVYLDNNDLYQTGNNSVDTYVSAGAGTHNLVVQAWDGNGSVYKQAVSVTVNAVTATANVQAAGNGYYDIDQIGGWESCNTCAGAGGNGPQVGYSMSEGISSPSIDGRAAQFWLAGGYPYSGALWWKELTPQPGASHFAYDLYFYYQNASAPQALEFDVNQVVGGARYILGTECNFRETGTWRVWDTTNVRWVNTGITCNPSANNWNHLTWQFQRNGDGSYTFVSVTLNGQTNNVNQTYWPKSQSGNELNVAVQLDSNYAGTEYSVWVDKIGLSYY